MLIVKSTCQRTPQQEDCRHSKLVESSFTPQPPTRHGFLYTRFKGIYYLNLTFSFSARKETRFVAPSRSPLFYINPVSSLRLFRVLPPTDMYVPEVTRFESLFEEPLQSMRIIQNRLWRLRLSVSPFSCGYPLYCSLRPLDSSLVVFGDFAVSGEDFLFKPRGGFAFLFCFSSPKSGAIPTNFSLSPIFMIPNALGSSPCTKV